MQIVTIAGSPSVASKSASALDFARRVLVGLGISADAINARDLNAEDLLYARANSAGIAATIERIAAADGVIVATPIYKAAYSGILKAYLDLLPANALSGKVVLPLATGATPAHLLAIDYALRPVLAALGSQHILSGVYLIDSQWISDGAGWRLDDAAAERLTAVLNDFTHILTQLRRQTG